MIAWRADGIAQEVDIETGEVLFEWHSLDHVGIEEHTLPGAGPKTTLGLDYFHINSIDVDHDDNLLVSARNTSAVYKIDRETGEVIWRLGGQETATSRWEKAPGCAYQHDARRQPDGTISIFDNGTTVIRNSLPVAIEASRDIVLELDEQKMKATLLREYMHPDKLKADASGNAQLLNNGDVFVGWGRALAIWSSAMMASCSSTSDCNPITGPTGPSASHGTGTRATGLPLWQSAPQKRR